jgi:CheY-like chemotaxis protein
VWQYHDLVYTHAARVRVVSIAEPRMSADRHILIVEDDDGVRIFLSRVIARTYPSATVEVATNGASALDAVARQPPDLLVADVRMPVLSGLDLVRALRARQLTIPILMISANPELGPTALEAGATRFLAKPPGLVDLQQTLVDLLPP